MTYMETSKLDPGWAPIKSIPSLLFPFFFFLAYLAEHELTCSDLYHKLSNDFKVKADT